MTQHKWLKECHAWLDDPESVQCQVRDEWHAPQGINNPIAYPEQNWRIKPKDLSINDRDSLIADQKIQLGRIADLQRYQRDYNELRKVIDNGSEVATHASALYKVIENEETIERLTAEITLAKEVMQHDREYIEELMGERDALAKDAARYRWLRSRIKVSKQQAVSGSVRDALEVKVGCSFIDSRAAQGSPAAYSIEQSEKLDAAIDAAKESKT